MKLVNIDEGRLYYIRSMYGSLSWGSKKSFVRIGNFKNKKLIGSKMYCCSKNCALVFKSYEECNNFRKLYKCDDEICELELKEEFKDLEIKLKEYNYKNCRCYEINDENLRCKKIFKNNI